MGEITTLIISKIKGKKSFKIVFVVLLCFVIAFIFYRKGKNSATRTQVKEEHETGGFFLSEQAKQNIGLKTAMVDYRTIEEVIMANGIVRPKPDKFAIVSSRISGRVTSVHVNVGSRVEEGDDLVDVESLQYGQPPPVVHIKAPISGTIVERHVFIGEPIVPEKILFKIVDPSEVWVEGDILEQDISQVEEGQRVRVRVPAYPEEIFRSKIIYVKDTLDSVSRTGHIWVELQNPEEKLKPEMFAELAIVVGNYPEVLSLSREAVIEEGASKFVFVEKNNRYFKQEVVLGAKDDRFREVVSGLSFGEAVVTQGNHEIFRAFAQKSSGEKESAGDGHTGHAH